MKREGSAAREKEEPLEPARRYRGDRPLRLVRDPDGLVWRIREISFVDTSPSLVFESEGIFRRVRHYPRNWHELPDAQLYALSWGT